MGALHKLNVKQIPVLEEGIHGDGGSLYLRVRATGSRSWVFVRVIAGKRYERGLGSPPDVTLSKAREFAQKIREALVDGMDPELIGRKKRTPAEKVITFRNFAFPYIEEMQEGFKNAKHRDQWRSTIETYAKPILDKSIKHIDQDDILGILKPIWQEKQETARRVLQRLARILDAAKVRKLRDGENPAQWKGNLELLLGKQTRQVKHHDALEFKKLPDFMRSLRAQDGMAAKALEFTILNAARTGETIGATWDEFDFDQEVWTIPAERMKAKAEHKVPLSPATLALLRPLRPENMEGPVFSNPRGGALSNMAMAQTLKRMKFDFITVHGFRSTFRDWAGDVADYPREVIEMALAHTIASKTEAAYRRGSALEKRRELMNEWSTFVDENNSK